MDVITRNMTHWETEIERTVRKDEARIDNIFKRLQALEAMLPYQDSPTHNPATLSVIKEQAAKYQAMGYGCTQPPKNLYAPLRSNVDPLLKLSALARRMLDPDDLGHAVSEEVRNLAREALGLK